MKQGDFASVAYDHKWYFVIIQELDTEEGDVESKWSMSICPLA